ncbi:extensin family protein [Hyphomicrobium sp.]|uniref:extensin-like domain-containing protein n=1 Tax=Hyphomicrobium sp. TaxID=82 RepID=UPI002E33CFCE|nr:extensin family protein [Hyphomicrobium sp.]HEX2843226.1 extensin family protein [Hyphomicrobium sp.]
MKRREEPISGLSTGLSHLVMTGVILLAAYPLGPARQSQLSPTVQSSKQAALGKAKAAPASSTVVEQEAPSGDQSAVSEVKDEWPQEDVVRAREQCMHLLSAQPMDFEILEPIKKGECGLPAPIRLKSVGSTSKIVFDPPVDVNCRMASALGKWAKSTLQPEARDHFKSSVVTVIGASGYSCRNIYNLPNARLSQHALANAIDIGGFVLANGKTVGVLKGWGPTERDLIAQAKAQAAAKKAGRKQDGDTPATKTAENAKVAGQLKQASMIPAPKVSSSDKKAVQVGLPGAKGAAPAKSARDAQFLRDIHNGACREFGTVLGPEANDPHRNHFHLDLIGRRGPGYCE